MTQIDLVLENPERESATANAVKLQGALMRMIDTGLAGELHSLSLRPYSLFTVRREDSLVFRVSALAEKGYPLIKACETVKEFHLAGARKPVRVLRRFLYEEISLKDMCAPPPAAFSVMFASPATYKHKGEYQNWFSLPSLLVSIADKMRDFEGVDVPNDVLDEIAGTVILTDYELKSETYNIKVGNYIKGFTGEIRLDLSGLGEGLSAALMLLMRYACYCGVGAKTALGMGGILLSEQV